MAQGNTYPAPSLPLTGAEQFTIYQQNGAVVGTFTATISQIAEALPTLSFENPPPIGSITPNSGKFTTLTATGTSTLATVNSTGGALNGTIGATTPAAGTFTTATINGYIGYPGNYTQAVLVNPYITGWTTTGNNLVYIGSSDQINAATQQNILNVVDSFGGYITAGSRVVINSEFFLQASPNAGTIKQDLSGGIYNIYNTGAFNCGASYPIDPYPITQWNKQGILYGSNSSASVNSGAGNWYGVYGTELACSISTGTTAYDRIGCHIIDSGTVQGSHCDAAIAVLGTNGWNAILSIGQKDGDQNNGTTPTNSSSTAIVVEPGQYALGGSYATIPMNWGLDFRETTFTSGFLASPGFGVNAYGELSAGYLTTNQYISAGNSTLTGVTINSPGVYSGSTFPTVHVGASAFGFPATVTVTAMKVTDFLGFGVTGKNYVVNDVLTFAGTTGGSFTVTVNSVDSHGGILSWTITTNGTITNAANNPIYPTGGSGTGAAFKVYYSQSNQYFVPSTLVPAATGSGNAVNDVLTLTGDTGTAGSYLVASVDSYGGVLSVTVNAAGSVTGIASPTYHSYTTSGAGVGGSIQVGWGIASVSFTGGSQYSFFSPPRIIAYNGILNATMTAAMTITYGPMQLQPSGGDVIAGQGSTALATAATSGFFQIPVVTAAPTGTPATNGGAPMVYNKTTHNLNIYDFTAASWYHVALTSGAA